ncbi:MAG: 4Fe-4S binding protein [Trichlorobacter sp.]|uniref:ATP-binding protein n=1 Tax=Trichlorobacter sp. TaxID=2911007 RepID=UPI00256E2A78|nr:4Fe-4S binding protein [Trichlorobacter sp.]
MTLSRKAFFRKGLFSLGDTLLKVSGVLRQPNVEAAVETPGDLPYGDLPMVAVPRNECCLARNCGCFSCVEKCEQQAIVVVMGEGIRIDATRCTGCASCLYVCPVTPKAITLRIRAELGTGE